MNKKAWILILIVLFAEVTCQAAFADNPPIITGSVDTSTLVTLRDTKAPAGNIDIGPMPDATPVETDLLLKLYPNPSITADQYNADLQNPSSPYYHKWLAPDEDASMFGLSLQDIQAIETWLQSYGLTVNTFPNNRTDLRVNGTAAQFDAAFHTQLDYFDEGQGGQQHAGLLDDISVPAVFAEMIVGPVFGPPAAPATNSVTPGGQLCPWQCLLLHSLTQVTFPEIISSPVTWSVILFLVILAVVVIERRR